jgi:iron complex outermembrane receptor protein
LPKNEYYNERNLQSFFGRANIDLVDKYLFTFTLRADGSSFFIKEKRWGYFPAAGFSWRAKDESFLKNVKIISDLKFRLSWGLTGQQDVQAAGGSYYPYTALFVPVSAQSSYFPGVSSYAALPYDIALTWEKTSTYNAGIDFDVLKNNLLSGSIDVYQRYTKDLLSEVSTNTGQFLKNVFPTNVGVMDSKGAELNLNLKPIANDDFSLTLNGNISYNIAKITDLGTRQSNRSNDSGLPNGTGSTLAYNVVGEQPHSAWVFEQVYDANSKPIQGSFVDKNNDGIISDLDRKYVALRPNWTYGMGFTVIYKKFDLVSSFRGQLGGKVYNGRKLQSSWLNRPIPTNSNSLSNVLNEDFDFVTINNNIPFSDYYLENASFLRCQNVSLGYMFDKLAKGLSMKVNLSASNLFILTNYSGQDPENYNAIDNNVYPRPRTYSIGVNLDF